jgi:hypothetical protein
VNSFGNDFEGEFNGNGPFDVEMPDAMVFHDDDSAVELRDVDKLRDLIPPEPRPMPVRPEEMHVESWTAGGTWLKRWNKRTRKRPPSARRKAGFTPLGVAVRSLFALLLIGCLFGVAYKVFSEYVTVMR